MYEEKMEKTGERVGKKRKGDAPQGSRVTNEKWVLKKPVEGGPKCVGKEPERLREEGEGRQISRF